MLQQFFTAFTASTGQLLMGLLNTWPSYTQDLLTSNDTTILSRPSTEFELSLIGSIPSLGAMFGTAAIGLILEKFGRRKGGLIMSLPSILCWVIIEVSSSSIMLLIGRFLGGISGGASLVYSPMFISETAQESIRGMLATGPVIAFCFGALVSYLMGWFLSYHTIIRANVVFNVIRAVLCMLVVESPVYLMRQNKEEEARNAVAKYRGMSSTSKVVNDEMSRLRQQLIPAAAELIAIKTNDPINDEKEQLEAEKEKLQEKEEVIAEPQKTSVLKILFTSPASRRAFGVVFYTGTSQVLMGMVAVQVYAKQLFREAAPDISSNFCSVLLALVLMAGGIVTAAIADNAGRRILVITSSTLVASCLITMGVLMQTNLAPAWVTALMVLVYSFSFFLGAGPVPYILLAEVFDPEVQGMASMIFVEWIWFLNFFIIAIFPPLSSMLGMASLFYIFAAIALANAVTSFFIVPETKGLNSQEIQEKLVSGKR